jgi:hypothetical protein
MVLYRLSEVDVGHIRDTAKARQLWQNDYQYGQICPMVVTRSWSHGLVNGKLLLDADFDLVVTSRHEGEGHGQWHLKTWGQ